MKKWDVYSTAFCPPCLMVESEDGRSGTVAISHVSHEEWSKAFSAPSNPYPLPEHLVQFVKIEKG